MNRLYYVYTILCIHEIYLENGLLQWDIGENSNAGVSIHRSQEK